MILSKKDYLAFHEGHNRLLQFVGIKHGLIKPNLPLKKFISAPLRTKVKYREILSNDPKLLDEYIEAKDYKLDVIDVDVIKAFRNRISDNFIVLKSLKKYSIFIGNKKIYGVTALHDPFPEKIDEFPAYVKATLLPFRNKIIYDGFLEIYSIDFGRNIRKSMNQEYQDARKARQIISHPDEI